MEELKEALRRKKWKTTWQR